MGKRKHERRSQHETEKPFVQLPRSLIGGVVFAVLSITARRILDRLIAEHLGHNGAENGLLKVSYRQLAEWAGVNQSSVPPALAELVSLGLLVIERGKAVAGAIKAAELLSANVPARPRRRRSD